MFRELRIAFLIVLIYVIYGLTSLFSLGDFVTPFFLSKLILIAVSFLFLVLNYQLPQRLFLLFAFLAMCSLAISDAYTIYLITKSGYYATLFNFLTNTTVLYVSFALYFLFFYVAIFLHYYHLKNKLGALVFFVLLTLSLSMLIWTDYWIFEMIFSVFLVFYAVDVLRRDLPEKNVLLILSALFLLHALLEGFKYLF